MPESSQLVRQWKILRLLEDARTGFTLQEFVDATNVSAKTVRRDLKVLQQNFDITEQVHSGVKRWKMPPLGDQMNFSLTELMSLHMSQQFLEPLAGTPFWEGNRIVFGKVRAALGENAARFLNKLQAGVLSTQVGAGNYEERGEMIDQLMIAIEDRNVTLIVYQSMQATEPVEQEVYPLGLVHHRGSLYLIAWSSRREKVRNFKVDRIEDLDIQNLKYTVPSDFDLSNWLNKCFGVWRSGSDDLQTIRIHFQRDAARYVQESTWHESQRFEPQPDGSVIAEFQLPDTTEIKRWIMSFGPGATVLAPPELVEEIASDLGAMQAFYEGTRQ